MKKSRFTDEKIVDILREHRASASTTELCRKHGISDTTLYNWLNRFGDLPVSEVKRCMALDAENSRLKNLLADAIMDNSTLKEMLEKNF